jgi:hypothetical protein
LPDFSHVLERWKIGSVVWIGKGLGSLARWKSRNLARVLRLVDLAAADVVCLHMITFTLVNVTVDIVCLRTLLLIVSALVNLVVDIVCLHMIAFALLHVLGNILSSLE